jgi:type IV pilus assembly protein PilN
MIKINLLGAERKAAKKTAAFDISRQVTAACGVIVVLSLAGIGWRFWQLNREAAQIDAAINTAQQETNRLHSVIAQMQQFEQRKTQLQQRVTLIEQLRKEQIGPVHMLDQISLSLPPSLWLTEMKQTTTPNEVLIDGHSLSLTGLSDFVANLEHSGYFRRSVEIVNSSTDTSGGPQGEVIKFQIKALFKDPSDTATTASLDAKGTKDTKDANAALKPKG